MSFVLLGILNSQASGVSYPYWLATLEGSAQDYGRQSAYDSAGNFYVLGNTGTGGPGGQVTMNVAKYNVDGAVLAQKYLGKNSDEEAGSIAIDSSDNVIIVGFGGYDNDDNSSITKLNSSLVIQWQRKLTRSDGRQVELLGVSLDSSDNIYAAGYYNNASLSYMDQALVVKYNSSGTLQWQKAYQTTQGYDGQFNGLVVDSSSNLYVTGTVEDSSHGRNQAVIVKYNSSGAVQWETEIGTSGYQISNGIALDSSGNLYITGLVSSVDYAYQNHLTLLKYNSSGTLQWQRTLGTVDDVAKGLAVVTDSSGGVYVVGETENDDTNDENILVAKYNASGVLQWQRQIDAGSYDRGIGVTLDSFDNVLVTAHIYNTQRNNFDLFLAMLPNDGSLTGSYTLDGRTISYSATSLTDAAGNSTEGTPGHTQGTSNNNDSANNLAVSTSSLTANLTEI
jgi:uncharacterized delta-60 repeat protein